MAYGGFGGLLRRTASDKVLLYKAFNIAESPKWDGYPHGRDPIAYKFSDKNFWGY